MVVLDKFRVNIMSDGLKLKEYADPNNGFDPNQVDLTRNDTTQSVTRYIEAIHGMEYQVRIGMRGGYDFGPVANCLTFRVSIDGKRVRSAHVTKREYRKNAGYHTLVKGHHASSVEGWYRIAFRWGNLSTTDEPTLVTAGAPNDQYKDVGNIKIEVWRKVGSRAGIAEDKPAYDGLGPVPERAIKGRAIDMSTSIGTALPMSKPPHNWYAKRVDELAVAEFVFKYRSRKSLQAIGVLARSPTPEPLENRDPEGLTRDELLELARRFQASRQAPKLESLEVNRSG